MVNALYTIDPATSFSRTGLVAWLRADVGVTLNGSAVSEWADQSGSGNNATQAMAANRPALISSGLNGEPVLQFNSAANTYLAIPNSSALNGPQVTVFAVVKKTGSTNTSAFLVTKATATSWPYALELNGSSTATFRVNSAIEPKRVRWPMAPTEWRRESITRPLPSSM